MNELEKIIKPRILDWLESANKCNQCHMWTNETINDDKCSDCIASDLAKAIHDAGYVKPLTEEEGKNIERIGLMNFKKHYRQVWIECEGE